MSNDDMLLPAKAKGDANGDRVLNATDIVYIINAINGSILEGYNEDAADVNGDGSVDEKDVEFAENGRYPPTQNGDIRSLFCLFILMAMQN